MSDGFSELKLDQMIELLKDLKQKPKFNTTIKIITRESQHRETISPIIRLHPEKIYKAALMSFSTYNSLQNIFKDKNDKFKYSADKGATWKNCVLRAGSYDIKSIDRVIKKELGIPEKDEKQFTLKVEPTVNRISLTLDANHQVDFNIEHSLSHLLGFKKKLYKQGFHVAENLPHITDINSIVIHCDLVQGGYVRGEGTNAIYSFPAHKVPTGYRIVQEANPLFFFPIGKHIIDTIRVWITDENRNPISFAGEDIVIDLLIQEV